MHALTNIYLRAIKIAPTSDNSQFLIYLYISYKKKEKKRAKLEDSFLDDIESVDSTISDEQWGQKKYDLSKYKDWDKD